METVLSNFFAIKYDDMSEEDLYKIVAEKDPELKELEDSKLEEHIAKWEKENLAKTNKKEDSFEESSKVYEVDEILED